jgi:hypothetical protein
MLFDKLELAISPKHSTKQVTLLNGIGVAVCKMMGIDFWAQFQQGVEFRVMKSLPVRPNGQHPVYAFASSNGRRGHGNKVQLAGGGRVTATIDRVFFVLEFLFIVAFWLFIFPIR